MAQVLVRNLEDEVKIKLERRAKRHGRSMEEEIREILRDAAKKEVRRRKGLGTEIAALFRRSGLATGEEIAEFPRAQSRAQVITADQGHAIVFTTRYRPAKGARGFFRITLRHGVSPVLSGTRYTLGIIYHDAR
jgi:plasmid stability protein